MDLSRYVFVLFFLFFLNIVDDIWCSLKGRIEYFNCYNNLNGINQSMYEPARKQVLVLPENKIHQDSKTHHRRNNKNNDCGTEPVIAEYYMIRGKGNARAGMRYAWIR